MGNPSHLASLGPASCFNCCHTLCCVQVYEVRQYPKSPRYSDLLPIVGPESMLLTEGHVWKSQRESFNPGRGIPNSQSTFPFVEIGCTTATSLVPADRHGHVCLAGSALGTRLPKQDHEAERYCKSTSPTQMLTMLYLPFFYVAKLDCWLL
jgi:hypothetical protein